MNAKGTRPSHPPVQRPAPRGTILVAVVSALVVLQLLAVGLTLGGARDQDLTVRRVESARAFYAAESAVQMSLREMCLGLDEDADGGVGTIRSENPGGGPPIGPGGGAAVVTRTVSTEDGVSTLSALGRSGQSTHRVECRVR